MNRQQEIDLKHSQIQALLDQQQADAIWIRRPRNVAWFTAGADSSIPIEEEAGVYTLVVTRDKRFVHTANIEATRIHGEEKLEDYGFDYTEFMWYAPAAPNFARVISDDGDIEAQFGQWRSVLCEGEQARYRTLGADAAAALEETVRAMKPGMTEFEVASYLDQACRAKGGVATVNLIASDERISRFRHPLATFKRVEKVVMVIVCMRREGLIVAGTRFGYFGAIPADLRHKQDTIASIDAHIMSATQAGRMLGAVFADLQGIYSQHGEADQWKLHHQGGTIAYRGREIVATPNDPTVIVAGNAFAWNPSIVGCKSEDTMILGANSFEIVTAHSESWPSVLVNVNGQTVRKAGILEL